MPCRFQVTWRRRTKITHHNCWRNDSDDGFFFFFFLKKAHLPPSCQWYGGLFVIIRMQAALPRSSCICNSCAASAEAYQRRQVRHCVFCPEKWRPHAFWLQFCSKLAAPQRSSSRGGVSSHEKHVSCTFIPMLKWDRPHVPLSTAQGFDRLMPSGVSTVKMYWKKKKKKLSTCVSWWHCLWCVFEWLCDVSSSLFFDAPARSSN